MAILRIFPGAVQASDRARVEAERLRSLALDFEHTHEIYPVMTDSSTNVEEIMPTPDDVAGRWGNGDYEIYDDMGRNVLRYGSLREGRVDVVMSLPMVWLPGIKGDAESEAAAEEVAQSWDNIDEREIAVRAACKAFETGFAPLENVWGVGTRGKAKNLIAPVAMINRPVSWFGFDYLGRPRFKRQDRIQTELVPDLKVTFMRCGSLHTNYGRGYGQDCYPAVWTIDMLMKGFLSMTERFGWMPMIITYPNTWRDDGAQRFRLKAQAQAQWKNVFLIPGEVDKPEFHIETEGAYAAAGASGESRLKAIAKLEEWLSMYIQGSMYSSANQQQGSFARDAVADGARLYKAPGDASCIEAMLNRGFARPIMQVNHPELEESKWPRCAIDSAAASDLDLLIKIFESGARLKVPIAAVTWSEAFKIPLANPGDAVLAEPATIQQPQQLAPAPEDMPEIDAAQSAAKMMAEKNVITIHTKDGGQVSFFSDQPVYTENRGIVRASMLQTGDIPVVTPDMVRVA